MKFGLFAGLRGMTFETVIELCRHAEAAGWDAACFPDHFAPNTEDGCGDNLECWTTLASLAMVTTRIRIGTIVSSNTFRHPALLAKMAANVDISSRGRLICGLGAGWQENEHLMYGIPFYDTRDRLMRLDEACQVLLSLWTRERTTFEGRYYRLSDAPLMPKPVQKPHPELMIGGAGETVTLRIVAKYAGHWNVSAGADRFVRKRQVLERHCEAIGRDPDSITKSANLAVIFPKSGLQREDLAVRLASRLDLSPEDARDVIVSGSVGEMQEKLARMREAGVDQCFILTAIPGFDLAASEWFITEVATPVR